MALILGHSLSSLKTGERELPGLAWKAWGMGDPSTHTLLQSRWLLPFLTSDRRKRHRGDQDPLHSKAWTLTQAARDVETGLEGSGIEHPGKDGSRVGSCWPESPLTVLKSMTL